MRRRRSWWRRLRRRRLRRWWRRWRRWRGRGVRGGLSVCLLRLSNLPAYQVTRKIYYVWKLHFNILKVAALLGPMLVPCFLGRTCATLTDLLLQATPRDAVWMVMDRAPSAERFGVAAAATVLRENGQESRSSHFASLLQSAGGKKSTRRF